MRLKHLKQQMLIPREEYIINQYVNVQGLDVLLLSFTIEEDKNCLWLIHEQEDFHIEEIDREYREEFTTNRDKLLHKIDTSSRYKNFGIKEMEIQGQIVRFGSSSGGGIYEMDREGIMRLQHFAEKGLISDEWDDVKLRNLVIWRYEQMEGEDAPSIDATKELAITIKIKNDSVEIPIQDPFKVEFGKQDIGRKIVYYDGDLAKENYFFINEIYSFDVYEDMKNKIEKMEDLEMRGSSLDEMTKTLETICPRDKNLAVIKYETIDDVQLNFNVKDYLDSKPIVRDSASGIILGFYKEGLGINGYKLRECVLQPIDKDFSGQLEIELFSRVLNIPEETINITATELIRSKRARGVF